MKSLVINSTTDLSNAFKLYKGKLVVISKDLGKGYDFWFVQEDVFECAKLIQDSGGSDEEFVSQAEIIAYASKKFYWGEVDSYYGSGCQYFTNPFS